MKLFTTLGVDCSKPAALVAALSGNFENALIASKPGGIEQQEKEGQMELCSRSVSNPRLSKLPKDMCGCSREDFERLGIKFLDDADDLFVNVELPEGWSLIATSQAMWNDLIDNNGSKRVQVFYKAAFYDRNATIHKPLTRFDIDCEYLDKDFKKYVVKDKKEDKIIYKTVEFHTEINFFRNDCVNYLNTHYLDWDNFTKYWDN